MFQEIGSQSNGILASSPNNFLVTTSRGCTKKVNLVSFMENVSRERIHEDLNEGMTRVKMRIKFGAKNQKKAR